jgi:cyclopropane fatty-acyl-phospholipid synthase-like methyltransferase
MNLPYSAACDNNKAPIFKVLASAFANRRKVLEIGSGTGQHAVYFAPQLPHLSWQTADLPVNHAGINAWLAEHPSDNLKAPITMDLTHPQWPDDFDAVYSANTAHIVSWPLVQNMLQLVGEHLPEGGIFALYGPFNYQGDFTSESNRAFDAMLRQRDPASGIRPIEDILAVARNHGLRLQDDHAMPANNRLLVFRAQT